MGNSPYVLRIVMNPNGGANIRARRKEHDPQVSICSGRHLFKELRVIFKPTTVRLSLGTARCGPARRVVWGPGEKNPRLPDYPTHCYYGIFMVITTGHVFKCQGLTLLFSLTRLGNLFLSVCPMSRADPYVPLSRFPSPQPSHVLKDYPNESSRAAWAPP